MFVQVIPNRGSPPAILLRESYREGGKVKKRTLCNLTHWPPSLLEGFKALLEGGTVISAPAAPEVFTIRRALPHGHVAAVLGTLRQIGLDRILGPDGNRCRDLVIAMVAARLTEPTSKLATAKALSPETAASSLGEIMGLGAVDEAELYSALDWLAERQAAPARRHARALRRVLELRGGPPLRTRQAGLQSGPQERQAADCLRAAVRARRLPDRRRGVRGRHRRPDHALRPDREAQGALRARARRARRRPRPDHASAHRRGSRARRPRLDHGAARPGHLWARRGRATAAVAVRRARHGGDHLARLSRRTADRLPQSGPCPRAGAQARGPAMRHRARPRQGRPRRAPRAQAAAEPGGDRTRGRGGAEPPQGGQALRADDHG